MTTQAPSATRKPRWRDGQWWVYIWLLVVVVLWILSFVFTAWLMFVAAGIASLGGLAIALFSVARLIGRKSGTSN